MSIFNSKKSIVGILVACTSILLSGCDEERPNHISHYIIENNSNYNLTVEYIRYENGGRIDSSEEIFPGTQVSFFSEQTMIGTFGEIFAFGPIHPSEVMSNICVVATSDNENVGVYQLKQTDIIRDDNVDQGGVNHYNFIFRVADSQITFGSEISCS